MSRQIQYWLVWLIFSLIGIAVAMVYQSAAIVDSQYIPVSNDSFYHARRIIDAAISERGFYQFDAMIHVPEGSWLNWPWAYDFFMATALKFGLWIKPDMQPMKFLAYVPVVWTIVNVGLMTLIAREVRLTPALAALGLIVFTLLPLNQNLHGLGLIDHHFIEMTFVLLTVLCGLRFFTRYDRASAIYLGVVLGVAPAMHNGLFVLQIPILGTAFLMWLKGLDLQRDKIIVLAIAIFMTTLIAVLPSATFRDLQFEFWTLSWFHLYVAAGSAIVLLFLAHRPMTRLNFGILGFIGAIMIAPLIAKIAVGAAFVSGDLAIVKDIVEVQSPFSRLSGPSGLFRVTKLYSWLIFLAPLLLILHAIALYKQRDAGQIFLSVMIVFGLGLMLSQYRLHPFGSWALIIGSLLAVENFRRRLRWSPLIGSALTLAVIAVALQPPLRNQLFIRPPLGLNRHYAASFAAFAPLAEACSDRAGVVLAYQDDGHPIRYHTDCSVIINNFLITPLHQQKLQEAGEYLRMSPEEFLEAAPNVRYVFTRMYGIYQTGENAAEPAPIKVVKDNNAPLFVALTFDGDLPVEYELLFELQTPDIQDYAFVRVFEIVRKP